MPSRQGTVVVSDTYGQGISVMWVGSDLRMVMQAVMYKWNNFRVAIHHTTLLHGVLHCNGYHPIQTHVYLHCETRLIATMPRLGWNHAMNITYVFSVFDEQVLYCTKYNMHWNVYHPCYHQVRYHCILSMVWFITANTERRGPKWYMRSLLDRHWNAINKPWYNKHTWQKGHAELPLHSSSLQAPAPWEYCLAA